MVASVGPLATLSCEPRQIRKEAAAAMDTCAGVWLAPATTLFSLKSLTSNSLMPVILNLHVYLTNGLNNIPIIYFAQNSPIK